MTDTNIPHGLLHHTILKFIIEHGYAPDIQALAMTLETLEQEVVTALYALQDYHGVVLHPNSAKVWVVHPFALAPTNFVVRAADKEWWGNCAWCSLGVAALVEQDVSITTTLGADRQYVELNVQDGKLQEQDYCIHFPVPMMNVWDNVIYTCSTQLLFADEADVDRWCLQHNIPKGDVQPLQTVWEFSKVWYGNHLNPDWEKWTNRQAIEIFQRFGFTHPVWRIPNSDTRF